MRSFALTLAFVLLGLGACASHTKIPEPVRASISAHYIGKTVALTQSMYYGDLYDENEKWLLSSYPFEHTFHIVDLDGAPIHPKGQRAILPAGTLFVVQRVEFPDVAAMSARMLTTPRYNTWVYLTPADTNTLAPRDRKFFIVLLPMDLDDEKAVTTALNKLLAPPAEVTAWLEKRTPTTRVAIAHKDLQVGMLLEEIVASAGEPVRWFNEELNGTRARVAWYGHKEVWLVDDVAKDVRNARPVSLVPAAPPAPEPKNDPKDAPVPSEPTAQQ